MKLLDLPDGIRATVYGIIVRTLRDDPLLGGIIHPGGWHTYLDLGTADAPPGEDSLPSIELLPFGMAAAPASLVTQEAPFGIGINVATEGTDVRDLLNLWEAVEGALWKGDGLRALLPKLKSALVDLGRGQVATVNLTSPAVTVSQPGLDKQILVAAGQILVQLRVPK